MYVFRNSIEAFGISASVGAVLGNPLYRSPTDSFDEKTFLIIPAGKVPGTGNHKLTVTIQSTFPKGPGSTEKWTKELVFWVKSADHSISLTAPAALESVSAITSIDSMPDAQPVEPKSKIDDESEPTP